MKKLIELIARRKVSAEFCMLRHLKILLILGFMSAGLQASWAFSLLGPVHPAEPWQTPEIGYENGNLGFYTASQQPTYRPRQIGQEYRRTVPVLYYSANMNFREFFGTRGVEEIDKAFAVYNSLTNVSSYSADLSEFSTNTRREHPEATALGIQDLKTAVMFTMMSQLGLIAPERYVWALQGRTPGPNCPVTASYTIIRRNFERVPADLETYQDSSYVNGTLYSFFVYEDCGAPPLPTADAVEFPVDPLADVYTSVANPYVIAPEGLYLTDLTRDDVMGLQYLYRSNNINLEPPGPTVQAFVTNAPATTPLFTQDLGAFLEAARTNDAAALTNLYPGLVITGTQLGFAVITNQVSFVITSAPPPFAPAYSFIVTTVTNFVPEVITTYQHTFANIVTNFFSPTRLVTVETASFGNNPFAPAYAPPTLRTSVRHYLTNQPSGSFYILPPGLCGVTILSNLFSIVTTNVVLNVATNDAGETNVGGVFFIQATSTYFTNQAFAYLPITCPTNVVDTYQGIERVRFVHANDANVDPLTGLYRVPFTSEYTMIAHNPTNNTLRPVRMRRLVTAPDFLFTAAPIGSMWEATAPFNSTTALPGQAGPGTVETIPLTFVFNNLGPRFFGGWGTLAFLDTAEASLGRLAWGSFDGTTNALVIYPSGTSTAEFEYFRRLQILPTPSALPGGATGIFYEQPLTVINAQEPVSWSLAPASPGLPPGLVLGSAGLISGTPTVPGTYDFSLRLTDGAGRFIDVPFDITISP